MTDRNAIGIVRVSATDGRDGDSFASPQIQAERIRNMDGLNIIAIHDELDVSGGKPLAKRDGLRQAVESIEHGEAEVLVAAYFDRLFRSLKVQAEVVERVEKAGGRVIALDVGQVSSDSAAQWLSGTMIGAVSEYYRRSIGERIWESDARAIANGKPPFPRIPLGYTRGTNGVLDPDSNRHHAQHAFQMRASGKSWQAIQTYLADHGHTYTVAGIRAMLANRIYLGELKFGKLHNPNAHPGIIDAALFEQVQATVSHRGPAPKSDLLLSRLRILECGHCHGPMGPAQWKDHRGLLHKRYRCIAPGAGHASIDSSVVDPMVYNAAKLTAANRDAWAASNETLAELQADLERERVAYDGLLRKVLATDSENEPAAIEALAEQKAKRANAAALLAAHGPTDGIPFPAGFTFETATRDELRALIRDTILSVRITVGRRGDRWSDTTQRVAVIPRWGEPFIPQALCDPVERSL